MCVYAVSDLHLDHPANQSWLAGLPAAALRPHALILAGDVSDDLETLRRSLALARDRFERVVFVPGNHELWVRRGEAADSVDKFWRVLELCAEVGVDTGPTRVGAGESAVWIVPLFAWYTRPEEGPDSLFLDKPGEDPTLGMWADNLFTRWPSLDGAASPAQYFLRLNTPLLERTYDAPVVSFSHFLPRRELIFGPPAEWRAPGGTARQVDRRFNFSRVAGTAGLDRQLRALGARVHVYGHQHRNRRRELDGVRYVSRCLGYDRERRAGELPGLDTGPALVWPLAEAAHGR